MFSIKRASGKAVLIADIGDTNVGVSIVRLSHDGPATILASTRSFLSVEDRSREQTSTAILQLLEQSVDSLLKTRASSDSKDPVVMPSAVYAVLRSPWTRFRTAFAEDTFPEPVVITKDHIPKLAKKALAESTFDRANIMETGVMQVFLNGYPTGNPIGKRAHKIAVSAFESDVLPDIKRGVVEIIAKLLPGRTPVLHSGMRSLLTVLHEHIPDVHRYVIIDVNGSLTDCAVVRKEAIAQFGTAPEGTSTILKRINPGGLPEEINTQLRMLAADTCSTDACRALKESLARVEPELAKVYGEMFASFAAQRRLPNAVMLSAPEELLPWLQGFFSRIDFSQFTATTMPLTVEALSIDHLRDAALWGNGVIQDTRLAITAGSVNILEQS